MPHYDYLCTQCGHQEEIFQKMTDGSFTDCPTCKQVTFKRKFGAGIGLQFQGSGFYATDYINDSTVSKEKSSSCQSSCGCDHLKSS